MKNMHKCVCEHREKWNDVHYVNISEDGVDNPGGGDTFS